MENIENILQSIEELCKANAISKSELAKKLNIPYPTLKKWFFKTHSKRVPSEPSQKILKEFLQTRDKSAEGLGKIWDSITEWKDKQHRFASIKELADEIGWDQEGLNEYFQKSKKPPRLLIEKMAEVAGMSIPLSDRIKIEAIRRTEKCKQILLLLEEEIRWFRDSSKEGRDVFRKEIDFADLGYVSSLLTMLSDEEKFKRWIALTTNRFNYFKNKGEGK